MQIGINTMSTIGAMRGDFEGTVLRLREGGCSYFEAMSDWGAKPETVAFYEGLTGKSGWDRENTRKRIQYIRSVGMDVKGIFVFEECLKEQAEELGDYCKELGLTYVVLSFLKYADLADVYAKIQLVRQVSAVLQKYGVQVILHNHEHDYQSMADKDGIQKAVIDIILEQCSPKELMLEIDTGWLVYAGIDGAAYIRSNINRIAILHLKDIHKEYQAMERSDIFVACGEGVVDFPGILKGIREEEKQRLLYVLDQDASKGDIVEDHVKSMAYLRQLETPKLGIRSYSHIAFHVKHMEKMLNFYCGKLGMKKRFTLTTDMTLEFAREQEKRGIKPDQKAQVHLEFAKANLGLPLITYVEMAPGQFLEFFHIQEQLGEPGDLSGKYGYQHLAIQVENIREAWDVLTARGVEPDTGINMGPDYTWQFWVHDPDGNRIEFMEYTDRALQVC